uniref:BPTI/Kunitz inhibitor domain-containing protein n=1 Tax=Kryptolebias marmoratus TaxID=37003 RepID=A0A3Q3B5L9_KRYMA
LHPGPGATSAGGHGPGHGSGRIKGDANGRICRRSAAAGFCGGPMWFFDPNIAACSPFWFGGCDGNANCFNTEHECFQTCGVPSKSKLTPLDVSVTSLSLTFVSCLRPDACLLQQDSGSCQDYSMKWFFDTVQKECTRFWYGGCGGNNNRFETQEECEKMCQLMTKPGDVVFFNMVTAMMFLLFLMTKCLSFLLIPLKVQTVSAHRLFSSLQTEAWKRNLFVFLLQKFEDDFLVSSLHLSRKTKRKLRFCLIRVSLFYQLIKAAGWFWFWFWFISGPRRSSLILEQQPEQNCA